MFNRQLSNKERYSKKKEELDFEMFIEPGLENTEVQKKQNEVNHFDTLFYKDLQNSKYICVDESTELEVILKNNFDRF